MSSSRTSVARRSPGRPLAWGGCCEARGRAGWSRAAELCPGRAVSRTGGLYPGAVRAVFRAGGLCSGRAGCVPGRYGLCPGRYGLCPGAGELCPGRASGTRQRPSRSFPAVPWDVPVLPQREHPTPRAKSVEWDVAGFGVRRRARLSHGEHPVPRSSRRPRNIQPTAAVEVPRSSYNASRGTFTMPLPARFLFSGNSRPAPVGARRTATTPAGPRPPPRTTTTPPRPNETSHRCAASRRTWRSAWHGHRRS
jgi:hypothetical protein